MSSDLRVDAERDLRDIGAGKIEVYPLNKVIDCLAFAAFDTQSPSVQPWVHAVSGLETILASQAVLPPTPSLFSGSLLIFKRVVLKGVATCLV